MEKAETERKKLMPFIDALPGNERRVIYEYYWNKEIPPLIEMHITRRRIGQLREKAFRIMRAYVYSHPEARPFHIFVEDRTDYSYHVGTKAFNRTRTSEVEEIVLQRDLIEREALMYMPIDNLPQYMQEQFRMYRDTQNTLLFL